jgi:uncharacterized membrane protein (UPF0127 family)
MQNKETKKTASAPSQKNPTPYILVSFILLALIAIFAFVVAINSSKTDFKTVAIGNTDFLLEVADTEAARTQGLSERDNLAPKTGMLFDFKEEGDWRIWMLKMRFPIDIAWLDASGRIVEIKENAQPASYPDAFYSKIPARYVIEVPAFTFKDQQVKIGDTLKL